MFEHANIHIHLRVTRMALTYAVLPGCNRDMYPSFDADIARLETVVSIVFVGIQKSDQTSRRHS